MIALDALGVPAVGLCSNTITESQVAKLTRWARQVSVGRVTLMFDCDAEGERGATQALASLAQSCSVRFGWSATMFGGKFKDRQPESLHEAEWAEIRRDLA